MAIAVDVYVYAYVSVYVYVYEYEYEYNKLQTYAHHDTDIRDLSHEPPQDPLVPLRVLIRLAAQSAIVCAAVSAGKIP